jgi:DNA-binding transcriptional regulator YdaS (Cro superfamily)
MNHPITDFRKQNEITLEALARRLGIGKASLCKWEKGRVPAERCPDVEKITGIPRSLLRPDIYGTQTTPSSPNHPAD